ncbi:class I SAM-dependent methyltransferase [Novosphingobium guangzhouense]|uniref:SAM-dependent methyltransferase n=1 Tax=Novosphingobium guangzhouense TaxID=1850347 RepID=A0A2K2FUF6_9SPHN|nr:class I SAM-dependent methyltransferase [Novosphingobium guangzhouense]PNU02427.1 SAM-dependent methyltransferase [Novosphingobium guangzhouense]
MSKHNAYQVKDWNGDSGARWVANQQRLDAMLAVFGEAAVAAAAPSPGERVLDIGCGAGASSLALARRVGAAGEVLGLDISEALVDRARSLTPQGAPLRFTVRDAAEHDPAETGYDLLFSRFGVMFFDDPAAAFATMRRALKPGGRVAFVCWRAAAENDWVRLPLGAVRDIVPPLPQPAPGTPGPFSFGDPERVRAILTQAGFADIVLTPFDHDIPFGAGANRAEAVEDALAMAFEVGPLSRVLEGQPEHLRARAADAVRMAFASRPGERSVMIDGAAWIVTAQNTRPDM